MSTSTAPIVVGVDESDTARRAAFNAATWQQPSAHHCIL